MRIKLYQNCIRSRPKKHYLEKSAFNNNTSCSILDCRLTEKKHVGDAVACDKSDAQRSLVKNVNQWQREGEKQSNVNELVASFVQV